jgi:hypothetical protein
MSQADDDFTIRHSTLGDMMRQVELPAEIALKVREGSIAYAGRAMACKVAGQDVIVIAPNIARLDAVFNHIQGTLHGSSAYTETLRTDRCPEVVVLAKRDTTLDEEL